MIGAMNQPISLEEYRQNMIEFGAVDLTGLTGSSTIDVTIPEQWAREIEDYVKPKRFLSRFAIEKSDLQRNPGDTINISKRTALTATGDLTETVKLQGSEEALSYDTLALSPAERGNAVLLSREANSKSIADLRREAREILGDWAANKMDLDGYAALETLDISKVIIPAGVASVGAITSSDTLTAALISRARAKLEGANVPKFQAGAEDSPFSRAQGFYVAIIHPFQLFDLISDTDYKDAANQAAMFSAGAGDPRVMGPRFLGFDGYWDGVIIYATSNVSFTDDSGAYATKLGKGWIFGPRAICRAVGLQGENAPGMLWNEQIFDYNRFLGVAARWFDKWAILNDDRLYGIWTAATDLS